MKRMLTLLFIFSFLSPASVSTKTAIPESASTIEELKKGISEYYEEVFKWGPLDDTRWRWVHFNSWKGREIFMLWLNPFSGRAACYLHGYYFNNESESWIRFAEDFIDGTHLLYIKYPIYLNKGVFVEFYGAQGNLVRAYNISVMPPY